MALACLVADGHLLIEDVPGLGKTMLAKALARSIDGSLMGIKVAYPHGAAGTDIGEPPGSGEPVDDLAPVLTAADVVGLSEAVMSIYVAPSLKGYIVDVVEATRQERDLLLGVSPRG